MVARVFFGRLKAAAENHGHKKRLLLSNLYISFMEELFN
jgi:hypothetical protein